MMAISKVIKFEGNPDQLVWKHRDENITLTSQLIVDETHEALLVVNGIAADLFGPGTRTLSLPNIPIVNKLVTQIPTDGANPFPCKVFFVNKVHHLDLLWGTQGAPITLEDPDYQIFLHISLHGNAVVSVCDTRKFLLKLVGFKDDFYSEEINAKQNLEKSLIGSFKGIISAHVKDSISKMMINEKIGFFQMNANLFDISAVIKERLDKIFYEYGVALHYFNVESISVPESDYSKVSEAKERRASRIIEGYSWREEKQMEVAKTFAGNEGTMGEMGGMLGGIMSGAMMGGAISEIVKTAMSKENNVVIAPPNDVRSALHIKNTNKEQDMNVDDSKNIISNSIETNVNNINKDYKYCSNCGSKLKIGVRFCTRCGTAQERICSNCKQCVELNARFCSNCGTAV